MTDKARPKVLIVCGQFLDGTHARATQSRRLARTLQDEGVDLRVITLNERAASDRSVHYHSIPVKELRLAATESLVAPMLRFLARFSLLKSLGVLKLRRIAMEIDANFIYPYVGRIRAAIEQAAADFRPDRILFLAQPFYIVLIGSRVATPAGTRRLAFFSDPWPYDRLPHPYNAYVLPFTSGFNEARLVNVFRSFDRVAYTNANAVDFLLTEHPTLASWMNKTAIVPHLASEKVSAPNDKALIDRAKDSVLHVGHFTAARMTPAFEGAMIHLMKEHRLRFIFIGQVCDRLEALQRSGAYGDLLELTGPLPEDQCKYLSSVAKVNLIVEADLAKSPFIPSKVADVLTGWDRWIFISGSRRVDAFDVSTLPPGAAGPALVLHNEREIVDAVLAIAKRHDHSPQIDTEAMQALAKRRNQEMSNRMVFG